MDLGDEKAEFDFACLISESNFDRQWDPKLFIGEAKSFGEGDLLKDKDVEKLKLIAERLPDCGIVFAVLRDHLHENETARLNELLLWLRTRRKQRKSKGDLLILTGNELFYDVSPTEKWQELGGRLSLIHI